MEQDDYLLGLGDDQGISDLFDACDFDKMPSLALDDLLCSGKIGVKYLKLI